MATHKKLTLLDTEWDKINSQETKTFSLTQAKTLIENINNLSSLGHTQELSDFLQKNPLHLILDTFFKYEKPERKNQAVDIFHYLKDSLVLGNFDTQSIILDEIFKKSELYYNNHHHFESMVDTFNKIIFSANNPSLMRAYLVSFKKFIDNNSILYQENKEFVDDVLDLTYSFNESLNYSAFNNINYLLSNPKMIDYIKQNADSIFSYSIQHYIDGFVVQEREVLKNEDKPELEKYVQNEQLQAIMKSMDVMFYDCNLKEVVNLGIKQSIGSTISSYGKSAYIHELFSQFFIHQFVSFDDTIKKGYGSSAQEYSINSYIKFNDEQVKDIKKKSEAFAIALEKELLEQSMSKTGFKNNFNKVKI